MPIASTEEQIALQSSIRAWAKRTGTVDVVRGQEADGCGDARAAAERWASLAGLGVLAIGLPAAMGGADGTAAELAAALAQLTESLVGTVPGQGASRGAPGGNHAGRGQTDNVETCRSLRTAGFHVPHEGLPWRRAELTRCLSIAGGTTQILLSLVAERLLGLPREDAR